ncbi:hypothetical protein [Saccharothrix obliqua]|uniref:hypothetical protein n=1 Tax=Saccharothrix obliqua TaxID=2861747 RepID=UPI001C5DF354|nr:hypothetical protein [Saccharothrix obliqua]MBW4721495.1 hypothetical protein [Saccharothrix obliqua]
MFQATRAGLRRDDRWVWSSNSVSGRVDGPVVQIGVVLGNVILDADRVRSAYTSQVCALAPDALEGRDEELAVLSAFCTSTEEGYLWWQAEAWSGKSALLSWFVLHPPPGVRLVSFFVTSRLPGQNNRRGFVDNVLDQLYDITGEPPRTDLTDTTREPHLLRLLAEVAQQVRQRGEHFVLVVDGLDEDRGVDGSPDAHSIAALLPRGGVPVIVAGRPDPDLPDDVPPEHPLRTSARVETLSASPKAGAVRDVMIRDLKRLLRGSQVQQDLLGFVTAAGGGLTAHDLAELTGTSSWQVEDDLRTTAGRSFSRRPDNPPVFVLAHEQLHALASEMFGSRLRSYRERLRTWADGYRMRGWPSDTPRYLLRGYAATLITIGDVARLLDHATDTRRQELAHSAFGNHNASVGEIEAAQAVFLDEDEPDLIALTRLAVHRRSLQESADWIPQSLPQVWARAGRVEHAESLIVMISDPIQRIRELMATAVALHHRGHTRRASQLLDRAEGMVRAVNQYWGVWLHHELADAATGIGDHDRVRRVVGDVRDAPSKARVFASMALVALGSSAREQAEEWFTSAEDALAAGLDPTGRRGGRLSPLAFATMAAAAAALDHPERASELAGLITDPGRAYPIRSRVDASAVAEVLIRGGFDDAATSLARTLDRAEDREATLLRITEVMADSGRLDEAEAIARTAEDVRYRYARLAAVAVAAGRNDAPARANRLVTEIKDTLHGIPTGSSRRFTVMAVAVAVADAGHHDEAETAVYAELLPNGDFGGALAVAATFLRHGDTDRALAVIEATEQAARSTSSDVDERSILQWIDVMTDFRDVDRAEPLARSLRDADIRAAAWERVAEAHAATGDLHRFANALEQTTHPSRQRRPRMEMIRILLARGDNDEAVGLARAATAMAHRAEALTFIAERTRGKALLDETISLASDTDDIKEQAAILLSALRTAANMADRITAEQLLRRLKTIEENLPDRSRYAVPVPSLPDHLGTLVEIAERVDRFFDPDRSVERAPAVRSGMPPLWAGSSSLPFRKQLAKALTIGNWMEIVDRVVEVEPAAYPAITGELDRLHRKPAP